MFPLLFHMFTHRDNNNLRWLLMSHSTSTDIVQTMPSLSALILLRVTVWGARGNYFTVFGVDTSGVCNDRDKVLFMYIVRGVLFVFR